MGRVRVGTIYIFVCMLRKYFLEDDMRNIHVSGGRG